MSRVVACLKLDIRRRDRWEAEHLVSVANLDLDQEGLKTSPGGPQTSWLGPSRTGFGQISTTLPLYSPPTLSSETCLSRVRVLTQAGDGVATLYHAPFEDK